MSRAFLALKRDFRATKMWQMTVFDILKEILFRTLYSIQIWHEVQQNCSKVVFIVTPTLYSQKQGSFCGFHVYLIK